MTFKPVRVHIDIIQKSSFHCVHFDSSMCKQESIDVFDGKVTPLTPGVS